MRISDWSSDVCSSDLAQSPCQAALRAVRLAGARRIEAVCIDTTEAAVRYPGCDAIGPFQHALQAKMSIPFGVAATLARGAIGEDNYRPLDDPAIARLVAATTLRPDAQSRPAFPAPPGPRVAPLPHQGP